MLVDGCMACDKMAGKIRAPGGTIYEDDNWLVDHSVSPVMLRGFLIVHPKRHCEHVGELTAEEAVSFGPILPTTCAALTRVLHPEKVYVCSFGELVKHVHFYLIPRTPDMPASGSQVLHQMFREKRWICSDEEAADVAARVREELRQLA